MTNTTDTHLPTIVYVEDNDGDTLLLEEALRARGHKAQLLVIEKGDSALHYFQVKETAKDVPPIKRQQRYQINHTFFPLAATTSRRSLRSPSRRTDPTRSAVWW